MCSFRSLAAAQRFTPVSRLNLFYRHIRAKALRIRRIVCVFACFGRKKAKFLEIPPAKCYAILVYNRYAARKEEKKGSLSGRGGCHG